MDTNIINTKSENKNYTQEGESSNINLVNNIQQDKIETSINEN